MTGSKPVTVSGTGVTGGGALYNSGGDFYNQVLNITLAGDTTFGGSHRWDLANGSAVTGPYNVTLNLASGYAEWDTVTLAANVGNIEIAQGALGIKGMGSTFGNPAGTLTVDTEVDFWNSNFGANSGYAKNIHVLTNAAFKVLTSPNTFFNANVTLENGASWWFFYGSGSGQTMNGTYTLNGVTHLETEDGTVTFSNVISGPGGFVWDTVNNETVFTASNTYSGPTVIGSGLTLGLIGNGSISHSSLIFFGGSSSTNISLDVSGRPDKTLTLASGQTLAGIGDINGSLNVVSAGAQHFRRLEPTPRWESQTGSASTGTISATNAIVLNGTTIIKLNGSGTNDVVQSTGAGITYGGTLYLVNISATPLAAGNSFQIFNANKLFWFVRQHHTSHAWNGSGMGHDSIEQRRTESGAAPSQPVTDVWMSGGNLIFSGTNGVANGNYIVLTSTNIAIPLANWIALATNYI